MIFSFQAANNLSSPPKGGACNICFEPYASEKRTPLSLPCGHTVCSSCLKVLRNQCPTCRKVFQESQVQKNYALLEMLEEFPKNEEKLPRNEEKCSIHKREIDRFCKTCMKLMCSVCHCQHIGSAVMISDVNLRDEIQKSVMEVKSQEKALREKVNNEYQAEKKKIEKEEADLRQGAEILLKTDTNVFISEEEKLVRQAEEIAKQKIQLVEKEKQEAIQKAKQSTTVKIQMIQARHQRTLDNISSKIKTLFTPIEAKNQQLISCLKDLEAIKFGTLTDCANSYKLWTSKKTEFLEVLKPKQFYVQNEVKGMNVNLSGKTNDLNNRVQGLFGKVFPEIIQSSNRNEFEIGQVVDFCDASGVWLSAKIIGKTGNQVQVEYSYHGSLHFDSVELSANRILKRWRKGNPFQVNNLINLKDGSSWYLARVVKISAEDVFVHYEGWSENLDEWLPKYSDRIGELVPGRN